MFRCLYFVDNMAKGRISKRVLQGNKARQIFRKTNISYPLIRTRTCAYQGVRNVHFSENLMCFIFLKHPFWDSPFCLITDDLYSFVCLPYPAITSNKIILRIWISETHKYIFQYIFIAEMIHVHEYCDNFIFQEQSESNGSSANFFTTVSLFSLHKFFVSPFCLL